MTKLLKETPGGNNDEKDKFRIARLFTRVGISVVLLFFTLITVSFCYSVVFDRYAVFKETLKCAVDVLNNDRGQYWLRNGTLLGAERLGKLILWDSMLSIGIESNTENILTMERMHKTCFPRRFSYDYNNPGKWQMCSNNICANFQEGVIENTTVRTSSGTSPLKELFPLKECFLMDIKTFCPQNSAYYLERTYGMRWLSTSFMDIFSQNSTAYIPSPGFFF